jgi:hypothetical protein
MTARSTLIDKLMDAVTAVDLDDPEEDFVSCAAALLGLALSKLPADECEQYLSEIEGGALRGVVAQYLGTRQPTPVYPTGNGLQ